MIMAWDTVYSFYNVTVNFMDAIFTIHMQLTTKIEEEAGGELTTSGTV